MQAPSRNGSTCLEGGRGGIRACGGTISGKRVIIPHGTEGEAPGIETCERTVSGRRGITPVECPKGAGVSRDRPGTGNAALDVSCPLRWQEAPALNNWEKAAVEGPRMGHGQEGGIEEDGGALPWTAQ